MNSVENLDRLERSVYRARFDHGLFDVLIGAFLVAIGLMLHADLDYMPVIVFFIGVYVFKAAHEHLIEPRVGHVRLKAERRARLKAWRWLTLLALVVVVFGLLGLSSLGWIDYPDAIRPVVVTGCLALPMALAAWLFGIHRWFFHAAAVLAGGMAEWRFELTYGVSWYFSGGLVALVGLALLLRFLNDHPAEDGGPHGS
jgi:intracellular septation protein A